jgi:hypothetical protein
MHIGVDVATDWYLYNQLFLVKYFQTYEGRAIGNTMHIFAESFAEVFKNPKRPMLHIPKSFLDTLKSIKSKHSWRDTSDAFLLHMRSDRNIGQPWPLSDEQLNMLSQYILATRLMNDCLKLAVVSTRKSIIDSYCMPTKLWEL